MYILYTTSEGNLNLYLNKGLVCDYFILLIINGLWKNMKKSYPLSDHYDGKHFFNPNGAAPHRSFTAMIKFVKEFSHSKKWHKENEVLKEPKLANGLSLDETYITYVNHSCHLIQLTNLNILTDPIFSNRASPLSLIGPKRHVQPGIKLQQLPLIHVVVISHNHYDHMDMPTLKNLEKMFRPLFIVPLGNKKYLKNFKNVLELDWWQTHKLNDQQSITMVPAQHWSYRRLGDVNKALWAGFWITSGNIKIYFTGDSGYGPHFKMIAEKLGSPTISILPIGSYEPRWFMKNQHLNPDDAVQASIDLQSRYNIADHYLTFKLSTENRESPAEELKLSLKKRGLEEIPFFIPVNGETLIF